MRTTVRVLPEMLTWAIDRAGQEVQDYTNRYPNVGKWLSGEKEPTVKQLEDFARKLHLPFGYLMLESPPDEHVPIPYFRTGGNAQKVGLNVYDTILQLQQRQDWLREYLTENNVEPLPFVGSQELSSGVQDIVGSIRDVLKLEEDWACQFRTWEDALQHLVKEIEDNGIITVFNGVVGNSTSRVIPVEECRGFVLVDDRAPFLFINNTDFKSAQMFTVVHELAHVWLGESAGFDLQRMLPANDPIEILCDKVAAEFLVPKATFDREWEAHPETGYLARYFKVSEIVVARRALDTGKWSKVTFFKFYNRYSSRAFEKNEKRAPGGDFYRTTKKRVSLTFAAHVNQAVRTGQLLYRDAYRLTSLKGDTYNKFIAEYL